MRSATKRAIAGSMYAYFWAPLSRSRAFRRAVFDGAPANSLLLSTIGEEAFVVASGDIVIGRDVYADGGYDFTKLELALSLLPSEFRRELLVDVGANIGTICIPAVRRGYFSRAQAVEPEPRNFSLLSVNVHLNGLGGRIALHNLALGAVDGQQLELELSAVNFGDHRVRMSSDPGLSGEGIRKSIPIQSNTFDTVIGDVDPNATLVWMDTQGFEGYVLKGASSALSRRPPLVVEFWPYGLKRSGSYEAMKHALVQAGYKEFYDLDDGTTKHSVTLETFDALAARIGDSGEYTDLLVC